MNSQQVIGEASIRTLLDAQRNAFQRSEPASAERRIELIERAIGLLVDHQQAIVDALASDFGHRSKDFSRMTDILSPLLALKQAKAQVAEWMRPEPRHSDRGEAWVEFQPLGVIGIVTPWNFPINLAFVGLAGALAAGNRVMIKPSEFTPESSALLARMIESVYAAEEVCVVQGGAEVAQAFCAQPFDHLLFTGSTAVGREVMRAAAQNLVPVTLELGGKSPTILSRSADFPSAVRKIITGKAHNVGQICLAPDYLFVPEEQLEAFLDGAQRVMAQHYPTLRDNPDYSSVINAAHFQRLQGYLAEARDAGVRLVELNPAAESFAGQTVHKMPLTLLCNPGDELTLMQQEIFGPLLPVKTYREIDEVIAYINAHPRPLGLYWFGDDAEEQARVLRYTTSGGVTLNDVIKHVGIDGLPFGGVGPSGMGAYHGRDGFLTFSHRKAVFRSAEGPDLMCPPYGEQHRQTLASLLVR